jgi:hypothetical protein
VKLPANATDIERRRALADWITRADHPLTARVMVNRVWQHHFGRGLVGTPSDFGFHGGAPSHPELLDWLAATFIEDGWSQKALIRRIVTSAAYRQSSAARPELAERDPGNTWLARQNRLRLPAELVRDNALAVSGLLFGRIGGPSIHPPQPEGVGDLSYSRKDWPEDTGPERYRRGLYIFFRRTSPYPMLVNFDAPDTLTTSVARERTDTPLQALNLLNDPVFIEAAQALALRVCQDSADSDERVGVLFELALGRGPTATEAERVSRFQAAERSRLAEAEEAAAKTAPFLPPGLTRADLAAWTSVARGMLNLDEFVTRE